jgi:nucleotide-binding universal stress UspA family protein
VATIGVAFDGSHESRHALSAVIELARPACAQVALIGAVHIPLGAMLAPYPPAGSSRATADRLRANLEQTMGEAMRGVPEAHRGATDVHVGDPVEVVSGRSADVDLLVCGSRGYGLLRQVLLGGVSGELLRHAECPLLVVPRGGELR